MSLKDLLKKYQHTFASVLPASWQYSRAFAFDLSTNNHILQQVPLDTYTQTALAESHCRLGIGKYLESRAIYQQALFKTDVQARTVHLGMDLMVPALVPLYAPLNGHVHTVHYNPAKGDYGYLLILRHRLEQQTFFTLYGHLNEDIMTRWQQDDVVETGQCIARIGTQQENGGWLPHLHFQIIANAKVVNQDYPGVCTEQDKQSYAKLCPDPSLILQI